MAEGRKWGTTILVFLFAGGVVALGAHELQRRFTPDSRSSAEQQAMKARELVRHLKGDDMRASMAKESLKENPRDRPPESQYDKKGIDPGDRSQGSPPQKNDFRELLGKYVPFMSGQGQDGDE